MSEPQWPAESFNPLAATGMLRQAESDAFLGSCAVYARPVYALTAAHCVARLAPEEIKVVLPVWGGTASVVAVHRHPSADLAVLRIKHDPSELDSILDELPFRGLVTLTGVGEGFGAYGFPEHQDWDGDELTATGRLLKGHFQRLFTFKDHTGEYSYPAGEMSVASPRGLSGGPLFSLEQPDKLAAIAAANVYSSTPGELEGTVSYGIAVLLWTTQVWLDEQVSRP